MARKGATAVSLLVGGGAILAVFLLTRTQKPYTCPYCGESFATPHELLVHTIEVHDIIT